jgi:transcriptional regulator with XRE-family HTH domain
MSTMTFGERLAAKRRAAHLTQEQLGEAVEVGKGAVSSWEVNRTQPSSEQITKLCVRLKCSADELLGIKWDGKTERRKDARTQ